MSPRAILRWPDPRLQQVCAPVTGRVDPALIGDLFDTLYAAKGRGLAAPQIGVMLRVFVMDTGWKDGDPRPFAVVNPEIVSVSERRVTGEEACLSIPGISASVARYESVVMRWQDPDGAGRDGRLEGVDAICAQHEHDHLDGRLTVDRLGEAARAEALAAYGALP